MVLSNVFYKLVHHSPLNRKQHNERNRHQAQTVGGDDES